MGQGFSGGKSHQVKTLLKEAIFLGNRIAERDKKIEKAVRGRVGDFAVWWEKNVEDVPAINFVVGKAGEAMDPRATALEAIFTGLLAVLKVSETAVKIGSSGLAAAVMAPFEASKQPSNRMGYLDDHPDDFKAYLDDVDRLNSIRMELFMLQPTSASTILQTDRCAKEACLRSP